MTRTGRPRGIGNPSSNGTTPALPSLLTVVRASSRTARCARSHVCQTLTRFGIRSHALQKSLVRYVSPENHALRPSTTRISQSNLSSDLSFSRKYRMPGYIIVSPSHTSLRLYRRWRRYWGLASFYSSNSGVRVGSVFEDSDAFSRTKHSVQVSQTGPIFDSGGT